MDGQGFCCDDGSPETAQARALALENNFQDPDAYEKLQFYYHPDHLGSSSYITNLDGEVVQHIEYVPFGEVFIEERNSIWNTPYLFNAKEFDEETGLYYYGARYYDSRLSLWISTDPMQERYPSVSSYTYCINNPIVAKDEEGKLPVFVVPIIKGAIGAVVDAAAQVTVSMAKGNSFGEAVSEIDLTSVGASFVTSMAIGPGVSKGLQSAAKAATLIDVAADYSAGEGSKTVLDDKTLLEVGAGIISSKMPGVLDNAGSKLNKAITEDLQSNAAATLSKGTKKELQRIGNLLEEGSNTRFTLNMGDNFIQGLGTGVIEYPSKDRGGTIRGNQEPMIMQPDALRVEKTIYRQIDDE